MKKISEYKIIGIYFLAFVLVISVVKIFFIPNLLSTDHFLNWDAIHYFTIKKKGYDSGFIVAFFPLFPIVWKGLHVGVYGIVLFNAFLFLTSFYFLIKTLRLKLSELMLYLSIPSFLFFYLPYSESIFFSCCVLLILSIQRKIFWLTLLSLFLCSLSRPAFTVLIPALLLMEFLTETINFQLVKRGMAYFIASFLGVLAVGWYQYYFQSHEWFAFFNAQEMWGNKLQIPVFPLRSWGSGMTARHDGVALLIGCLSGVSLLLFIFKSKLVRSIALPKEVVLSLAYLSGMALTVFLFRGGSLFSLNRFVFATPFIIIAVNFYLKQEVNFKLKNLGLILFLIVLYWLCFGSYVHLRVFLKCFAMSLYVLLLFGLKSNNERIKSFSLYSFIALNFFFQIYLFIYFLMKDEGGGFVA